jgi:hypothetical protein
MAWPSRRLRWPFLAVALLTYSLALACHLSDPARPPEIEPEALGSLYHFLMFPRGEVPLYESRRLAADEVVGTLQRAVGVSQEERAADVVAVNTAGGDFLYARVSQLAFLPDSDDPAWIDRWRQAACPAGAACSWQTEEGDDGGRIVRLSIVDREHARRDLFTYETDGARLLHVYAPIRRSIFDLLSALTIFLIASGVTVGLAFIIFRGATADGFGVASVLT